MSLHWSTISQYLTPSKDSNFRFCDKRRLYQNTSVKINLTIQSGRLVLNVEIVYSSVEISELENFESVPVIFFHV